MAAFAQTTPQPGTTSQTQPGAKPAGSAGAQSSVIGCVQREADYRKARDAGTGGVAGTGVGAGTEFVLINAALAPAPGGAAGATAGSQSSPTGTTGTAGAAGMAYELTGANEGQVEKYVGQRVEVTGTVKAAETTASGAPTGGPTAGAPPQGIDVTSKDLQLRELEVMTVKAMPGAC
jgi:hypothetical protein